jgi:hypothetical protein
VIFKYSWDRASLDIEVEYMTNKMEYIYTHRLLKNSTTHPKLIHRSTITSDPRATTQRIVPPPKHRAWNVADRRENHTAYNTVQLHIQFRAPDDGQWWPETCRAFLTMNIANLSHLVGHIFHLYWNMCFDILYKSCLQKLLILRRTERDVIKNIYSFLCKVPIIIVRF